MKKDTKLLKELDEEKRRNFESNLAFVRLRARWLMRTSNKEWSRQRKMIIDEVYKSNRHLRIKAIK